MQLKNTFIRTREALINGVLRIKGDEFLNPKTDSVRLEMPDLLYPAREIIQAINMFKAVAIDETGEHIDYRKLAQSEAYRNYRNACSPILHNFDPQSLATPKRKLAFWINLYNAIVIDAVIAFGVQKSVTEGLGILSFFRKAAYQIGGHRVSLEDIEQGILRGNRGNPILPGSHFSSDNPKTAWIMKEVDPRIHFALNCASRSCPPIGVYSPDHIETQLDMAARNFIDHETSVRPAENILEVSRIFDWYGIDFGGRQGVIDIVLKYMDNGLARDWLKVHQGEVKLKYMKYDWGLNI